MPLKEEKKIKEWKKMMIIYEIKKNLKNNGKKKMI